MGREFLCRLQRTRRAMSLVGIPEEEQLAVCRTVAAILHLGNVAFAEGPEESSRLATGGAAEKHLGAVAALLGVQWPDRRQVGQATAVVLGFVVIAGGFLGLMDAIWKPIVQAII